MPGRPGAYRLSVVVRDGRGGAAVANVPLHVKGGPAAEPLAEWVRRHDLAEPRRHLPVVAESEVRIGEILQRPQPQLLETCDLRLDERLVGDVLVRAFRAPQVERSGEPLPRRRRVVGQQRPACGRVALESRCVNFVVGDLQPVAPSDGGEVVRVSAAHRAVVRSAWVQRIAQPRHMEDDGLGAAVRRVVPPQRVEDPVGRDDAVGVRQEEREEGQLPTTRDLASTVGAHDLDRAQDTELHGTCLGLRVGAMLEQHCRRDHGHSDGPRRRERAPRRSQPV